MSIINSTGLYGSSYLFDDVEHLKTLSAEHDTRLNILEPDNTTNKTIELTIIPSEAIPLIMLMALFLLALFR